MDEPGTYDNSNSNTNTNAVSMPAATADTQEQHFIQYIFFGSTDVHKLYTPESVDNNSTNEHREKNTRSDCAPALAVMSCDDFKRAICKANNFNACVAPRLKLYKYPTQTSPTEYKRAESICQGTTVLIALGGEGGASSALQEILPLLVVPAPCSFSPQPPLPTQSEFNPKHFPLPGIDPSLDPALLRASREGKAYPTGALSVVTDCPVLRGLLSAGVEDFRVRREAGLVGVMRAVAAVTQNPDNTSVFAALPQLLTLTTEAFDCLSAAYLQVSQEQQQQTSSALNGTVVGNGVGYCLQTLVNLTHVQYFWCNRSKASVIHTKACPEVVSAIQSGRAPETIAGFIESLEQMVRNKKDTHKQQLSVLVLAIEALGAITYESLPVLTRLGCRKSFLDALVRVQRADPNGSHAEDKQLEFRMHQAAFTFLVVGARGSPAFSKEAADAGALDAIVDTLLWAVEAFYKGEAENEELNPVCDREDYFLEAVPQTLRGNASATPLGSFMGILNDALTGGTTYSQWLMEGLLTALFDAERPGECAQNARTIYTKFPELQYQFVVCLCILATPVPCSKPTCDALGSESGSEFDRKDGGSSSNDGSIVSTNSNDSEENGCSSDGSPSNPMNLFLCDKKLWNILFSECFMRIGSEEKDGTVRLSARKYFVVLRQKICEFAVRLSGVPEVRLATLNNILQEFHEVQCVEVRVICVEIMASIFAKYANDPAVIADAGFIVPSVCIPLTILSEKAAQIQDELRSSPALKSILERYKSSRSATIASITDNPALRRKFVANNNVIDGLFGLLNDHEIGAFALSEITGLLLVDADKKEPVPTVQKGLETLADRCVKYISTFSGGHSSEQDFDSEVSFLHGICDVCQHGKRLQLLFVRSGIFFSLLTLLTLQIPRFPERKALLLDECLCTLYSLFLHNKKAKAGFEASIGYENLKVTLYSFFEYVDQQHVLARLFEIVVESRLAWNPNTLVPTIQNPRMLLFVCELLPLLNRDVAKYVIDKFMFLVKALPNRSICCKNGILTALLEVISSNKIRTGDEDPEEKDATKKEKEKEKGKLALKKSIPFDPEITPSVINVIQALGSYSLNVSELKRIIYILSLSGPSKTRLPEFPYLVNALRTMPTLANVPRSFFDFNGSNSRFVLPVLEDEPFAKGFTFCVWIRFESLKRGAQNGAPGISTVFSFSGERQRLELYIQNETPVLRILSYVGSRQPQQQQQDINDKYDVVTFAHCHIPERKWMFLSVAIAPGLINGETKIYLGRDFYDRAVIKFPKLPNLTRNELGRSTDAAGEGRAFFGEMGNIHVFGEPLTQAQICAIYEAGPGYTDVFRSPEFYVDGTFIFNKTFLLSYNALAQRNGSHVMNLTTLGGISDSQVLWRAAKMRNVETSMIRTLKDIIASAEGVFVLFPLILMLGNPPHPGYLSLYSDKQLLVFIVQLINSIVVGSPESENEMVRNHGYAILSHVLKKIPSSCLSPELVEEFNNTYRLAALNVKFQESILRSIITDFTLWVYAPPDTQRELILTLKDYARSGQQQGLITVSFALTTLQLFYWTHDERPWKKWALCGMPRLSPQTKEVIGTRPPRARIEEIRRGLYELVRAHFSGEYSQAVSAGDIKAIVGFLAGCCEPEMAADVLRALVEAFVGRNALGAAEAFVLQDGLVELIRAAGSSFEPLQAIAIEMISRLNFILLNSITRRTRPDVVATLLHQKLALQPPIGITIYRALFRMAVRPDSKTDVVTLVFPEVLRLCIFPLLTVPGVAPAVRTAGLDDLADLFRMPANAATFLLSKSWERPLSQLLEVQSESLENAKAMTTSASKAASIVFALTAQSITDEASRHSMEVLLGLIRSAEGRAASASSKRFFVLCRSVCFHKFAKCIVSDNQESSQAARKKGTDCFIRVLFFVLFIVNSLVYTKGSAQEDALRDAETLSLVLEYLDKCKVSLSYKWEGCDRWKSLPFLHSRPGCFLSESVTVSLHIIELVSVALSSDSRSNSSSNNIASRVSTVTKRAVAHLMNFLDMYLPGLMTSFQSEYYHIFSRVIELYCTFPRESEQALAIRSLVNALTEKACAKKRLKKFLPEELTEKFRLFASKWASSPDEALASEGWEAVLAEVKKRALPFETTVLAPNHEAAEHYFAKLVREDVLTASMAVEEETAEMIRTSTNETEEGFAHRRAAEEARLIAVAQSLRADNAEGAHDWRHVMRALTSGKGPWGTAEAVPNWKLDKTENSARMRLKMKRNYGFSNHDKVVSDSSDPVTPITSTLVSPSAPPSPSSSSSSSSSLSSSSSSSVHSSSSILTSLSSMYSSPEAAGLRRSRLTATWLELVRAVPAKKPTTQDHESSDDTDTDDNDDENNGSALSPRSSSTNDAADILRQEALKKGIIYKGSCELIRPGRIVNGKLSVLNQRGVYFLEDLDEGAVRRRKSLFWPSESIKEVHMRRYLLAYTALEIFFHDCTNVFINFGSQNAMRTAYKKITKELRPPKLAFANTHSPKSILKNSGLMQLWVAGEISNFDYLMALNTIAGRTYNDLRQYPVFPWIIADYTSEKLDFNNPATFRDLSKPVGALNPKRLQGFRERYEYLKSESAAAPVGPENAPPFMYGTHYSSPDTVLFYLIRTEPFTSYFLRLQGRFDVPDRMFCSVNMTWRNCLASTGDIKELIPEFFYFPDFLRNANDYNLGKLQTGARLDDVILPPWAHGSPEEFVRINREALESPYVSAHLHEWIDLIFGYKQRGKAAIKADNVFCHFTYEGAVDLNKIADERTRIVMRDQIANFGQTPSQLLTAPHPQKGFIKRHSVWLEAAVAASAVAAAASVSPRPQNGFYTKWSATVSHDGSPIVFAWPADKKIVTVSASRTLCSHGFVEVTSLPDTLPTAGTSTPPFILTVSSGSSLRPFGTSFDEKIIPALRSQLFSTTRDGKLLFSSGFWDGSFKVVNVDTREVILSVYMHKDIVSCVKYTEQKGNASDAGVLVTGSNDTTVMTWLTEFVGGTFSLSKQPAHILYGHNDEITSLDASADLDIVASGDKSGCLVVHTIRRGNFVWSATVPRACPISFVKISPANGHIFAYSKSCNIMAAYDINGRSLCVAERCGEALNDLCVTSDGKSLISCSAVSPSIWIWDAATLVVLHKIRTEVPVLTVSTTGNDILIVAGTKNGGLLIVSPKDFRQKAKL